MSENENKTLATYCVRFVPEFVGPGSGSWTFVNDTRTPREIHDDWTTARTHAMGALAKKGSSQGSTFFLGTGTFLTISILSISHVSPVETLALDTAETNRMKTRAEAIAIERGDEYDTEEEDGDDEDSDEDGTRVPPGLAALGSTR